MSDIASVMTKRLALALGACLIWFIFVGPNLTRSALLQAAQAPGESDWFHGYTATQFRELGDPQQGIAPEDFREPLLSAAIFHETNRRRKMHHLPALRFHAKVRAASLGHARQMAKENHLSHGRSKQPPNSAPHERLVAQGLRPAFSAENVASNFILQYESGRPYYARQEEGRTVFSYEPGGQPLSFRTYLTLAETVVTQWMKSPSHSKNILAMEPEYLGIGCALSTDATGFVTIYVAQDFFTPMPKAP